jgi:hypothetical protein
VHINRFAKLIDSYRLATKELPPAGHILVHNLPDSRVFRAWWTKPATEFVLCDCGWRPDLGKHYRVQRPGSYAERLWRRRDKPALNAPPMTFEVYGRQLRRDSNRSTNTMLFVFVL